MREKSIQAMENRKHRDRLRMRAKRKAKMAAKRAAAAAVVPNQYLGRKLFKGPPLPPMSKSELRAMLAQAAANTAQLECGEDRLQQFNRSSKNRGFDTTR